MGWALSQASGKFGDRRWAPRPALGGISGCARIKKRPGSWANKNPKKKHASPLYGNGIRGWEVLGRKVGTALFLPIREGFTGCAAVDS